MQHGIQGRLTFGVCGMHVSLVDLIEVMEFCAASAGSPGDATAVLRTGTPGPICWTLF